MTLGFYSKTSTSAFEKNFHESVRDVSKNTVLLTDNHSKLNKN